MGTICDPRTLSELEHLAQEGKGGTELRSVADTVQEAAEEVRQRMRQGQSALKAGTPRQANECSRADWELAEEIRGRQEGGQER